MFLNELDTTLIFIRASIDFFSREFHKQADTTTQNMMNEELECISHICNIIFQHHEDKTVQDAADFIMTAAWKVYQLTRHSSTKDIPFQTIHCVERYIFYYLNKVVGPRFSLLLSTSQKSAIEIYQDEWQKFITSVALLKVVFLSCDSSWGEFHSSVGYGNVSIQSPSVNKSVEMVALSEWKYFFFTKRNVASTTAKSNFSSSSFILRLSAEVVKLLDQHRCLCYSEEVFQTSTDGNEMLLDSSSSAFISDGVASSSTAAPSSTSLRSPTIVEHRECERDIKILFDTLSRLRDALKMLPAFFSSDFFMNAYLKRMGSWYSMRCSNLSKTTSTLQYMRQIFFFLKDEMRRSSMFFPDRKPVLHALLRIIVKYSPEPLTEDTFFKWMSAVGDGRGCAPELLNAFKLLNLREDGGEFMKCSFRKYAKGKMENFLLNCKSLVTSKSTMGVSSSLHISHCDTILFQLIFLLRHLEKIVLDGFMECAFMQGVIDETFEYAGGRWSKMNIKVLTERLAAIAHLVICELDSRGFSDNTSYTTRSAAQSQENTIKSAQCALKIKAEAGSHCLESSDSIVLSKELVKLGMQDILKLFYFFNSLRKREENCFCREYQQLLAKRLLLFFQNDGLIQLNDHEECHLAAPFSLTNQRRLEKQFLISAYSVVPDPTFFLCYRMLSSSWPVDRTVVDEYDVSLEGKTTSPYPLFFSNQPSSITIKSRLIPKTVWGKMDEGTTGSSNRLGGCSCPANIPLVGFLLKETERIANRISKHHPAHHISFSSRYSTCVVSARAPESSIGRASEGKSGSDESQSSSFSSQLRLHLTWIQMWIVLCFNRQHVWEVAKMKEVLGVCQSEERAQAFMDGLEALCKKKILRQVQDGDKLYVAVESVKSMFSSASVMLFQKEIAGENLSDLQSLVVRSLPEKTVDKSGTCMLVSVVPDATISTSPDESLLQGFPFKAGTDNVREMKEKKNIKVKPNEKKVALSEKEWSTSQSSDEKEDDGGEAKLRICSQDVLASQLLRVVKEKSPITLGDLYTAFTTEIAPSLHFFAPIPLVRVKAEIERLIERGFVHRREGGLLYYAP